MNSVRFLECSNTKGIYLCETLTNIHYITRPTCHTGWSVAYIEGQLLEWYMAFLKPGTTNEFCVAEFSPLV
jgi:hypothetical protein